MQFSNIIKVVREEAPPETVRFDPADFAAKLESLRRLVLAYVTDALHGWGVYRAAGEAHTAEELMERFQIFPRHRKLLTRWLNALCDQQVLKRDKQSFVNVSPFTSQSIDPLLEDALNKWPDAPELVNCIKACGESVRAILIGEQNPLEILFPAGSFNITEAIYQRSVFARYCNAVLAKAMEAIVREWHEDRPIRILEIGAGVGGTTQSLLPVLAGAKAEYTFTDLSKIFLVRSSQKFRDYSFVSRKIFNVEKAPEEQGFEQASVDVVVAANVLHATRDIRLTMRHASDLLRPQGLLLVWEITEYQTWLDMTFALLDGWALHSDDIRTDSPILSISQWDALMNANGLSKVHHFPENNAEAKTLGNTVFVAEAGY